VGSGTFASLCPALRGRVLCVKHRKNAHNKKALFTGNSNYSTAGVVQSRGKYNFFEEKLGK